MEALHKIFLFYSFFIIIMSKRCIASIGQLIPQCPPENELVITGEADYYFWANASREIYKATFDMVVDPDARN